jgi:hypothetical protein
MTLLAPPNILPNAMFLICKALTPRGAFNADRLKALVQPPSLRLRQAGPSTYDVSLKALVDLRLVVREGEQLRLDGTVRIVTVGDFYQRLLLAVMGQADDREGTAQDLLRMLSWFAAQDPYGAPFDWPRAERQLLRQYEDAGMRPVTNSNPYEAFERWAVALGFAERGADGLVPDATRALLVTLPALPPVTGPARLGGVLTQLRTQLPVLDGGRSARAERALLVEDAEHRADPEAVDAYLTHALLRCEEEGALRLTAPSDADLILLSDGGSVEPRSHIEVLSGAAA